MASALVIGGTRFIGRHAVVELLDAGYDVTVFNRGEHENPFAGDDRVDRIEGDRRNDTALEAAAVTVEPDVVIDCVAYAPREVRAATTVFGEAGVDAYVYVSSGDAYADEAVPKREGETPLEPCTPEQATDDADETYGPRKAEGDRAVFEAAADGVNAMAVRPCIVYGPHDYSERLDYWIDRVARYDRIVVPGDGQNLWHRAYVEDVARALRIVAERGDPGEAYNVGDRRLLTLDETVHRIADALDTEVEAETEAETGVEVEGKVEVEAVHASERELSIAGLAPGDFVLYRDYPHMLDTAKLASLGWDSTPLDEAVARTVADHLASDRDGSRHDPGRDAEERVLGVLDTV